MSETPAPSRLAFEDFPAGRQFSLVPYEVTHEEIVAFAEEFDPQPFHLDEEAAKETMLGGLAASGWHSCAMMMRMTVDSYLARSTAQGSPGVEWVKWLRPVRPADTLSGESRVVEARRSTSRPWLGIAVLSTTLRNQKDERVLEARYTLLLLTRAERRS